jgi:hypothetical protein
MSIAAAASPLRLSALHSPYPTTAARAGFVASPQVGSLTFSKSLALGVDSAAGLSSANLDDATTKLTLTVDLKAGQNYSFSFYYTAGGPKVTLTDGAGKKTTVNMARGFSVKTGGTYQLTFEAGYSLKNTANLDDLVINAKAVLPKTSGDKRIDALITGGTNQWWHPYDASATKGTDKITPSAYGLDGVSSARELTFSFLASQPAGQSMTGFQEMTEAQKSAVRKAFAYYSKIINVAFTEVGGDGAGDINFGTNNQANSAGYASLPNGSSVKDKDYLYLANNVSSNGDGGMEEGGYGWMTVLHEIGHTLGLKHPGNYNAGGGGAPGPYLSAKEDNRQYTLMSYKDNSYSLGMNATTAMVYDVAALQYLYGANKDASTADNGSFTFSSDTNYLQTLWSASGTDSIDLSQLTRSSNVDLNPGAYSSINITGPLTNFSYSGNRNVGIAYGSQINSVTLSATDGVSESVTLNKAFATGGYNTINSFDATDDRIALKKSLFGSLRTSNIEFGTAATTKNSKIIVNRETGEIFYDADGVGTKAAAKKIAQFSAVQGRGEISLSNFSFVA